MSTHGTKILRIFPQTPPTPSEKKNPYRLPWQQGYPSSAGERIESLSTVPCRGTPSAKSAWIYLAAEQVLQRLHLTLALVKCFHTLDDSQKINLEMQKQQNRYLFRQLGHTFISKSLEIKQTYGLKLWCPKNVFRRAICSGLGSGRPGSKHKRRNSRTINTNDINSWQKQESGP